MHQDYNGDGKTDAAVWLGSEFGPTSLLISNTGESGITGGAINSENRYSDQSRRY